MSFVLLTPASSNSSEESGYIFPKGDPKKLSQSSLSVVGHVRSEDLSTSFLETFSTIIIDEFDDSELSLVQQQSKMTSRAFFEQFINLKTSNEVDLSYLEILLKNGANVNFMDTYGHTVLHEVARNWKVDVAEFLVEQGAAVNHCDMFGRTALHVAAAANNVEMIEFLIQNKGYRIWIYLKRMFWGKQSKCLQMHTCCTLLITL
ncbi:uncharacterized protein [Heptranchias perlo]|uniref:uncharacterized protein n=1 Tax=Heptranchias perlo TaxID=212740 RepID=UPI00355A7F45